MSKAKPFTKRIIKDEYSYSIVYKINGFWSQGCIRVDQYNGFGAFVWQRPSISRAIGGIEVDVDPIDAEENFAAALLDAIREARRLDKRTGKPVRKEKVKQ